MKKIIVILCLLIPNICWGAIAYDNSAESTWAQAQVTTFAYTVSSGDNRLLIVNVVPYPATVTVSSVTYNGDALTLIKRIGHAGGDATTNLYSLINPDTGTNNIVVTLSGNNYKEIMVSSYTGVDTTNFPNVVASSTGGTAEVNTFSATTTVDDCWLVSGHRNQDDLAFTGGAERQEGVILVGINDSNGSVGAAGTYSFVWTKGVAPRRIDGVVLVGIPPAGGSPPAAAVTPKANIIYFD